MHARFLIPLELYFDFHDVMGIFFVNSEKGSFFESVVLALDATIFCVLCKTQRITRLTL